MKYLKRLTGNPRKVVPYMMFFGMAIMLSQCFTIVSVDQPGTAAAGDEITVKVVAEIDPSFDLTDMRLVAAVLVPKSWGGASNIAMTYTSSKGNGTMSVIPSTQLAPSSTVTWPEELKSKIGIGDNLIDEVEWVAFWSDQAYNVTDAEAPITGEITITLKVGPQNLISQLGYFIGESTLDLGSPNNYNVFFPECFTVTSGTGATIDFCNPQIASVAPIKSLDNDIITITFDASVGPTALAGASQVYLCAKGFTADGSVTVCTAEDKTKMVAVGENLWRLDLWPRDYFNVASDQTLERIEFSFTNEAGDVVVNDPGSGLPIVYEFSCN